MLRIKVTHVFAVCLLATVVLAGAADLPVGMKMVDIPGGTFEMLSIGETVTVGDFKLSETEVTWGQYIEFLNSRQPSAAMLKKWIILENDSTIPGEEYSFVDESRYNYPVVYVTKAGAKAFCNYYGLRLPKEAEWEYAACGPEHTKYPWGDEFDGTKCCYRGNNGDGYPKTMPVKSFSENGFGLYDMAGNAAEWCAGPEATLWGGSWSVIGPKVISDVHGGHSTAGFDYASSSTQTLGGDNDGFWCPGGNAGFRPAGD